MAEANQSGPGPAETNATEPAVAVPADAKPDQGIQVKSRADTAPETGVVSLPPVPAPATTAAMTKEVPPEPVLIDGLLLVLVLVITFFLGSFAATNADLWTHLAAGRLLAGGEYQFGVDPFAFTTHDVYWANHSWLFDWLLYVLYGLVGDTGLVIAKALVLVVVALVLLATRQRGPGLWLACAGTGLAMIVMSQRFVLRSECFSLLFLGLTVYLLLRPASAVAPSRGESLWLLPPLFALWVNMDAWFFLGPLTVAFFLLGTLVQRWRGQVTNPTPGRLGLIFLAGLAACLLNPHHIRAFTLPPEAAYVAVQATDWIEGKLGISVALPAAVVAGGRTFQGLQTVETQYLISPFSSVYLNNVGIGKNAAGLLYFLLLFGSLLSFGIPMGKDIPAFPWTRLFVWLPFALLSMLQFRLIAFFAVVAGPVMVLNFQDILSGLTGGNGATARGLFLLARLATGLAFLIVLGLAWPGWLHRSLDDSDSPRRVSWKLTPDPSLQQAALRLEQLHKKGVIKNGLILWQDLAAYCSWFAPDVKGFFDYRYSLFSHNAESYAAMRKRFDLKQWSKLAAENDINYVATSFKQTVGQSLAVQLWLNEETWPFLYGDGRTVIFGWTPNNAGGPLAREAIDVNKLAFAEVASDQRPAADGADFPATDLNWWQTYAFGKSGPSLASDTAHLYQLYYQVLSQKGQMIYPVLWHMSLMNPTVATAAAGPTYLAAATTVLLAPVAQSVHIANLRPAAVPLVAIRSARRGVAATPYSARSFAVLADACKLLRAQEDLWSNPVQDLRFNVRQVQVVAALKTFLTLEPQNFHVHKTLAEIYLQMNFLDLAQEQLAQALKYPDPVAARLNTQQAKQFKKEFDDVKTLHKRLEADLTKRREEFDLRAKGLGPVRKADLALRLQFKFVDALNKEHVRALGLAQKALTILQEIDMNKVKLSEEEKYYVATKQIELLLLMGRVKEAREDLTAVKKLLPPGNDLEIWAAAAVGDYATVDKALALRIKNYEIDKQLAHLQSAMWLNIAPGSCWPQFAVRPWPLLFNQGLTAKVLQTDAQWHLIRGLMALEAGDNAAAARSFQETFNLVGATSRVVFPERDIARRYLELLKQAAN